MNETEMQPAITTLATLRAGLHGALVGQREPLDLMLIVLSARGHALLEGVPGLAKTTAVKRLAELTGLGFRRVQMTPDQLPADLTGAPIFDPETRKFEIRRGPIFAPFLLADEINRAPPKVQSALLEAMEERQVTLGGESLKLPEPFVVFATQNPIEHDGTFPLPEAQLDRFLCRIDFAYPDAAEEELILEKAGSFSAPIQPAIDPATLPALWQATTRVRMDPRLRRYILALSQATRVRPGTLALGVSPRGGLALQAAAQARALLHERDFVLPEDIYRLAPAVFGHRLILSFDAEGDGLKPGQILREILQAVPSP